MDAANDQLLLPTERDYELMDDVQFADGGREVQMRKKKTPDLTRASA